jgi:hypothetical protein
MRVDNDIQKKTEKTNNKDKPTIHNVIIANANSSMKGGKYNSSIKSIKAELNILAKDTNSIFKHTLVEFDDSRYIKHFFAEENAVDFSPIGASGFTPLYNTMGKVFKELEAIVKPNERVLIKVFTDGADNEYGKGTYNANTIGVYINKLINKNNWTITFNCTNHDKANILQIGIPESNILTHDDTAEDIERVSQMRAGSTIFYSKSVNRGVSAENLVSNFYSKSIDNEQ